MKVKSAFAAMATVPRDATIAVSSFTEDSVRTGESVNTDLDRLVKNRNSQKRIVSSIERPNENTFLTFDRYDMNQWQVENYCTYSSQNKGTQDLLNYV
ncbi:MAG: hypothetical protein SWY16_08165 [Cyanobacteriota bacterium]|nr:hypothetical protein [Cyanobacteriota bacterium]